MPTASANKEYNTFIKGIITEANPLSFPENASIDEENFILNRNGSRNRRYGIDFEDNYVKIDTEYSNLTFTGAKVSTYSWDNVSNDATLSFGVVFIHKKFWFMDLTTTAPSANLKNGGLPLTVVHGSNNYIQMANINGDLYYTIPEVGVFRISYNVSTDSFSTEQIVLWIRDTFGVDDGLDVDERPSVTFDAHQYNLRNQGWPVVGGVYAGQIGSVFASSSDVYHLGKDSTGTFSSAFLLKQVFGNTPAPKGKFIISLTNRGLYRLSNTLIYTLKSDWDQVGPSTIASSFGRLFYSGFNSEGTISPYSTSPKINSFIVFSKIISSKDDAGVCHQEADPTSEHVSDIVDTDGGYITIPEAINISKLVPYSDAMLVFAENGVWSISGGETNFTATSYSVSKLSEVGVASPNSIVVAKDTIFYWGTSGIYVLTIDQTGGISITNISESTIQKLFEDIPSIGRANVTGAYDAPANKVYWMYNDLESYDGISLVNSYNKEIVFDVALGAFYKNSFKSIAGNSPMVSSYLNTFNYSTGLRVDSVLVNGEQVQANGEDVVVTTSVRSTGVSSLKYLTYEKQLSGDYSITLSWKKDTSFNDWKTANGVGEDAEAFLTTGYDTLGDTMRNKIAPYVVMSFKRTEDGFEEINGELEATNQSSCLVQARWDFSDSQNSGKFGTTFQAYKLKRDYIPLSIADTFDYGQTVITTKNKIRGSGRALSLKMTTEPTKNCHIYGWAISYKGRTRI